MTSLDALLAHPDIARLALRLAGRRGRTLELEGAARYAAIALVLRPSEVAEPELLIGHTIEVIDSESNSANRAVLTPAGPERHAS